MSEEIHKNKRCCYNCKHWNANSVSIIIEQIKECTNPKILYKVHTNMYGYCDFFEKLK